MLLVTPYIYLNDGENAHSLLIDMLDTAAFADLESAHVAMDSLLREVAASVFGPLLTVEFDIDDPGDID